MTAKINWWCDNGANIHSCIKDSISLDELGITLEEWKEMSGKEREDMMRDVCLATLAWGYALEGEE